MELFWPESNQRHSDPSAEWFKGCPTPVLDFCWAEASPKVYDLSSRPPPTCSFPIVNEHVSCFCSITHSSCLVGHTEPGLTNYTVGTVLQQWRVVFPVWSHEAESPERPAHQLLPGPRPPSAQPCLSQCLHRCFSRLGYFPILDPVGGEPLLSERTAHCPLPTAQVCFTKQFPWLPSLGVCGSQGDSGELACGYPEPARPWSPQAFPGLRARLVLRPFCLLSHQPWLSVLPILSPNLLSPRR